MSHALPDWLEHYESVPDWVVYESVADRQILWVNQRFAADLGKPRDWFVGRHQKDVWTANVPTSSGERAVAEQRTIDAVSGGHDLAGNWRWLNARVTPVGTEHVLVVAQDITSRIQLEALRLVLGRDFGGEIGDIDRDFAEQLLQGASLSELCKEHDQTTVQVLGKLSRLVAPDSVDSRGLRVRRPVDCRSESARGVPDWIHRYWDLPSPAVYLDYPKLWVLWVNQTVLERNETTLEQLVGLNGREVWSDVSGWLGKIDETMTTGQPCEFVHYGENLRGHHQWMAVQLTPVSRDRLLLLAEDVTSDIRLHALRLILGLSPTANSARGQLSEPFARLLLEGASANNIAAALEMTRDDVLGQAGLILDRGN